MKLQPQRWHWVKDQIHYRLWRYFGESEARDQFESKIRRQIHGKLKDQLYYNLSRQHINSTRYFLMKLIWTK